MDPHAWEYSKENARPLKSGYKASTLSALLDSPPSTSKLEEERRSFEIAVAASGGEDPLATWKAYISWAEKHSVTGSVKIDRKKLLERCAKQFRDFFRIQK